MTVAEIPDIVIRGAKLSNPSRPGPQDNIMQFWQAGRDNGLSNRDELEHSSTVEPANEVEVCEPHTYHITVKTIAWNE